MDSNFEIALIAASVYILRNKSANRKKRRFWSKPWLLRRPQLGSCNTLLLELRNEDPVGYKNWTRMDQETFLVLLDMVRDKITKKDTHFREAISAEHRLALTLRYLATGESQTSMSYSLRIAQCTISKIIHETAKAIYETLKSSVLKIPQTELDWKRIAEGFWNEWQFPNCIGSLDGKHINIAPPRGSGSEFYNYKNFFSIVLLAMVDYSYRFTYIDVGTNGRISDGGVWGKSQLKSNIENNQLNIPNATNLPYSSTVAPYVAVADDAFGLKSYVMRPYPGNNLTKEERVFNYRLSRARRVVENSFGILANRWRFLLNKIPHAPEKVEILVLASTCLHNFLIDRSDARKIYLPNGLVDQEKDGEVIPGSWRQDYQNGTYTRPTFSGMRASLDAKKIQEKFKIYFNREGLVPWQDRAIHE